MRGKPAWGLLGACAALLSAPLAGGCVTQKWSLSGVLFQGRFLTVGNTVRKEAPCPRTCRPWSTRERRSCSRFPSWAICGLVPSGLSCAAVESPTAIAPKPKILATAPMPSSPISLGSPRECGTACRLVARRASSNCFCNLLLPLQYLCSPRPRKPRAYRGLHPGKQIRAEERDVG